MGFYLRKSVSVGPFRFNLSGSGVGVSVGMPGFRVGSGPRGNYVHMGGGGIYYKHTFEGGGRVAPRRELVPASATHAPLATIESASAAGIADSSSEELLNEIRKKRRKTRLRPLAIVFAVLLFLFVLGSGLAVWVVAPVAVVGVVAILAAGYRDKIEKTVVVLYDFEPRVEEAFRLFTEWAQALAGAGRAWYVAASGEVFDRKYHGGANALVQRHVTAMRTAEPPYLKTNVPVLSIGTGRQTLYFLPDRLLVYDNAGVGAVTYRTLAMNVDQKRFIEDGGVPSDATVVGHTWRYVNKSGGPDRRFSVNPQIPICLYDELTLRTASGLNEVVQVSRSGVAAGFTAAIRHLTNVVP